MKVKFFLLLASLCCACWVVLAEAKPTREHTIEAETLNRLRSSNYRLTTAESNSALQYVGHVDDGTALCYDAVDLTGINSIEFNYARGPGATGTGRIAILVSPPNGLGERSNLGEFETSNTQGWETFQSQRVGLSNSSGGLHSLCFFALSGGGIFNLDKFTLSSQAGENLGITRRFDDALPGVLSGAGYYFELVKIAEAVSEIWSMAFLPDGSMLATQKNGQLLLIRDGQPVAEITGTPEVWNQGQGGLLAVKPHPDYANNGWIYLTYADGKKDDTAMTAVARGKLNGLAWQQHEQIYQAPQEFYSDSNSHFGSRLAFKDGYVYFSIGERINQEAAQDLGSPLGKIHRLHDDGRIPKDNPFVKKAGALPSIWTYGHRNPQGMALSLDGKHIWSGEHGSRGGDELNLILKGRNYGWPLVSFGTQYDGTLISESPFLKGIEAPVQQWTPSIAISQIEFYTGDKFPLWREQLMVASLGQQQLRLIQLKNKKLVTDTMILNGLGRIRDVVNGPDGYPYIVISHPYGKIYRLVPAEKS